MWNLELGTWNLEPLYSVGLFVCRFLSCARGTRGARGGIWAWVEKDNSKVHKGRLRTSQGVSKKTEKKNEEDGKKDDGKKSRKKKTP